MIPMTKTVIIIDIKIIHKRIFGLSIQNKGPSTVKFTIFYNPHIALEMSQFYSCRSPICLRSRPVDCNVVRYLVS